MIDFRITSIEWRPAHGIRYPDPARNTLPEIGSFIVHWETDYDFEVARRLDPLQHRRAAPGQAFMLRSWFSGFVPLLQGEWEIWPGAPGAEAVQAAGTALYEALAANLAALFAATEAPPDEAGAGGGC